jgi:hypothetical protein
VSSDGGHVWSMLLADGLVDWASKPSVAGFAGLGLKTRAEVTRRNLSTWRHRGVRVEAKLSHDGRGGHRMKITSVGP